ncbi:MAG: flippase activity-associated protein Agl23, partial [archaeon]
GSYLLFVGVLVLFYAPRGGATDAPGLWAALQNPAGFPVTVEEALAGSWDAFMGTWGRGQHQEHAYLPFLEDYVERLGAGAIVTSLFAVLGFVADRYSGEGPRDLVALGFYWGVASLFGYPVITDIEAPWATVHTIVPLAIPAAVGLGLLYRWGRDAVVDGRAIEATLAVVVVVLVVGWTAGIAYDVNYRASDAERNEAFVHWTQPGNDFRWTLEQIERVSAEHDDGPDVLFYGSRNPHNEDERLFYVEDERQNSQPPAASGWYDRLPLPWYLERYDAAITSSSPDDSPSETLEDPPPVVIAYAWDANEVKPHLDGYVAYRHRFKLWGEDVVVYIHESYLSPDDY